MRKILLIGIHAKYIHSGLALYTLKSNAGTAKEAVFLKEYTINEPREEILRDIVESQPEVLAFSCYIWNIREVKSLLGDLSQVLPKVPIFLGGPEVSFHPEQVMEECPSVTGIFLGEGEETFREVAEAYEAQENPVLSSIAGLCIRKGSKIEQTKARPPVDLSSLVFPYDVVPLPKDRILYYESSRGCPFRCSYCLSSLDKTIRLRDLSLVKRELQFFLDHQVKLVKFVDRTFNCNREHTREIWKYIKEHDNGVTRFHFEITATLLEEEEFRILEEMRPGAVQLEIGIQSTNEKTIEEIRRKVEQIPLFRAVERIQKRGNISCHLDLIAGLPYEDLPSFHQSFCEVYALRPRELQLGFLKVLKGSYMEEQAEAYELKYSKEPPFQVLSTHWISFPQLSHLAEVEEMVEQFYNSGQFTTTLSYLSNFFPDPFVFFEKLSKFHQKAGYCKLSPGRMGRYVRLREFIEETLPQEVSVAEWLLIYDWYLREKEKSRLPWHKIEAGKLKEMREFYHNPDMISRYLPKYKGKEEKIHLEWFPFSPEETARRGTVAGGPGYFLFSYEERNPVTKEGTVAEVRIEDEKE